MNIVFGLSLTLVRNIVAIVKAVGMMEIQKSAESVTKISAIMSHQISTRGTLKNVMKKAEVATGEETGVKTGAKKTSQTTNHPSSKTEKIFL